ncbi:hypothetical protein [Butyrivibrio sp. INlla14]|uniref:hypothetical protein n=1 Tax=Butyrivibrio sp. INlla14 TaxID=1520808 RepID=UPI000876BC81|nr:hypothetical protein [Butyrivibrio sp. INlla14]SCY12725.1 hypothetical protein SAMN02910371_01125 [Butyrivibrio sp. INlla14]
MRVVIVSFSSRTDGNCAQIGKLIKENIEGSSLFSFSDFSIQACGDCNYDCFEDREKCPHIGDMEYEILDSIVHSDITYFVIPNYCDYPCANYFAFNERSQCYFQGDQDLLEAYLKVPKRSIVVSNTNEENFIKALTYQTERDPVVLFLSARQYGKKSIQGDLLTNEKAVSDILDFINIAFQ